MKTFRPWPEPTQDNIRVGRYTDSIDMAAASSASVSARSSDEMASYDFYMTMLLGCYHADGDKDLMDFAMQQISNPGPIFEFGTWEGHSINHIAATLPHLTIYGFDLFSPDISFKDGEDWNGHDFTQDKLPTVASNVILIKGLFGDTLPGFGHVTPSLIHIDCDNYAGAKSIFDSVNIIEGSIIVFDEFINVPGWEQNEYKAWTEYVIKHELDFEYIAVNTRHQQVAVRVL